MTVWENSGAVSIEGFAVGVPLNPRPQPLNPKPETLNSKP